MKSIENRIHDALRIRQERALYRQLTLTEGLVDFSSNDYLGLSRSAYLRQEVENARKYHPYDRMGATGSRLLNGNTALHEAVEQLLASTHHAEAALFFNSGFEANVGLISTVARPGDVIFYDALVHASIHQGMKLSGAELVPFAHNDMAQLESLLQSHSNRSATFIITESVFSMDGDQSNLAKLAELAERYEAALIVDEAHSTGLFGIHGSGLCNVAGVEEKCFARVYTFGKAVGCHGAAVLGSQQLRSYLINFCRNFIYTTAPDTAQILAVKHSYLYLQNNLNQRNRLFYLINYFNKRKTAFTARQIFGDGPIFGIQVPGNEACRAMAAYFRQHGYDIRPIVPPTVPVGTERLRLVLHSYNTIAEIDSFFTLLNDYK